MTHLEKLKELNIEFPDITTLNASTVQERYFKLHYIEFYEYVIKNTPDYKWPERLYMIYHNMHERPKCCACGDECKFTNIKVGYGKHCSRKCISKSIETKAKKEQTSILKWGVKNPMQSECIKEKIKQTNIERYGVECVYQSECIKEKIKQTNIERYGVEHALQNNDIKQKLKNTCLDRYGVEYISQSTEFKNICKQNSIKRYGVDHPMKSEDVKTNARKLHKEKYGVEYISQRPEVIKKTIESLRKNHMNKDSNIIGYTDDGQLIIKCQNNKCNKCKEKYFTTPCGIYYDRLRFGAEICTNILPVKANISTYELRLREFLDKYNIEYQCSVRNVISKELDIYIPSKKMAIEFNGVYYHSDIIKPNNYHINKFIECKEKDIQLISIWEDQYLTKFDIVKSIILSKLGIYDTKFFARKCYIVKVDAKTANDFYTNNHIQGKCTAAIHYALKYNDEIVSMMSFGKRSLGKHCNDNNDTVWELIRYCSKLNTNVIGGASKLFTGFIKEYNPKQIISWSSNDISNGNMYKLLGFEYINTSKSYWYIDKQLHRHHRSGFSKSNLIKKRLIDRSDTRTESQIMRDLHYYKIYDSGQSKWIYKQ